MSESDRKRGREAFERVQRYGGNPEGVFLATIADGVEAAADFEDGWVQAAEDAEMDETALRGY